MYMDSVTNILYWWDGTTWQSASGGGGGADLVYNGEYPAATPYTDGDIVIKDGIPYLCVRPTSAAPVPWAVTGAGLTGPPGPPGADGAAGSTGSQGIQGIQGPAGPGYELNAVGAADAAIANTETVVVANAPGANILTAGMTFAFKAFATRVGTNSSSAVVRIRVGATTLTGNVAAINTVPAAAIASPILIHGLVTIRTAGAGGTVLGSLEVTTHLAAVTVTPNIAPSTATVAVNTTTAQRIELTFISGQGSNTYTFRNAVLYRVV